MTVKSTKTPCEQSGHDYAFTTTAFNRDEQGIAFWGYGKNDAATFQVWVCRKCGGTIEVEARPRLVQREVPEHLRNQFNKKGSSKPAQPGYQPSDNKPTPTKTPDIGTTAVRPRHLTEAAKA